MSGVVPYPQMPPRRPYLQPQDKHHTARVDKALQFFNHAAWEQGTHTNQHSAWQCYSDCCLSHDLPADPVTYKSLGYFAVTCRLRGNKHSYLKSLVSNLKTYCTRMGIQFLSPAEETQFKYVMRGLAKFNPSPTERKRPITKAVLEAIILHADLNNLKDLQTITMAYLAHDALLRGRELTNLKVRDLHWESASRVKLSIVASKCNKDGPAEEVFIDASGSISAVSLLQRYGSVLELHTAALTAPLFPLVVKDSSGTVDVFWAKPTDKAAHFVPAIRALLLAASFDANEYSGHSFRAGGATDRWTAGCPPEIIKSHGRWKSDCFYIYIRVDPRLLAAEVASYFSTL